MNIEDFEVVRAAMTALGAQCTNEMIAGFNELRDWLSSLKLEDGVPDQPMFPKTPTAVRNTRKRPRVATIVEDEEVANWSAPKESPTPRVRGSRAASKNASLKMKEPNLNKKLRRPSDFAKRTADVSTASSTEVAPSKRQRRRKSSTARSSAGTSFTSARSTLTEQPSANDDEVGAADDEKMDKALPVETVAGPSQEASSDASTKQAKKKRSTKSHRKSRVTKTRVTVTTETRVDLEVVEILEPPVVATVVPPVVNLDYSLPLRVSLDLNPTHMSPVVLLEQLTPAAMTQYKQPSQSVKKRVAEYEKQVSKPEAVAAVVPPQGRITRTKARALASDSNALPAMQAPTHKADMTMLQKLALNEAAKENTFVGLPVKPELPVHKTKNTPFCVKPKGLVLTSTSGNQSSGNVTAAHATFVQEKSNILSGVDSLITKAKVASAEDIEEKKKEERRRREEKEEEAARKRKEMTDRKIEMQKRKREEKMLRVMAAREAMEREKLEQQDRVEREKAEKARQAMEREERLREEMQKKRQQAQQRAAEMEERRRFEEAQRMARIKEQEEEQKRLAAQRKKEAELAEQQNMKRMCEEREKEASATALLMAEREKMLRAAMLAKEEQKRKAEAKAKQKMTAEAKEKQKVAAKAKKADSQLDGTFVVPSTSRAAVATTRPPLRAASAEDYELLDLSAGESESEDERAVDVPRWAGRSKIREVVERHAGISLNMRSRYFGSRPCTPNLCEVFSNPKLKNYKRTSSAIWKQLPRFSMMPDSSNV